MPDTMHARQGESKDMVVVVVVEKWQHQDKVMMVEETTASSRWSRRTRWSGCLGGTGEGRSAERLCDRQPG